MNIDPSMLDAKAITTHAENAHKLQGGGVGTFILNIIPTTSFDALARNDVLQVLFFAVLFGVSLALVGGEKGEKISSLIDAVSTYSTFERASYTAPYNLTGSPALSVPIGFENGLPLAFQIAGKPFDEAGVMRVGHAFEQATEFHRQRPAIAASLPQHR